MLYRRKNTKVQNEKQKKKKTFFEGYKFIKSAMEQIKSNLIKRTMELIKQAAPSKLKRRLLFFCITKDYVHLFKNKKFSFAKFLSFKFL